MISDNNAVTKKLTLISQQTPSISSSLVITPAPEARQTPTKEKNGVESPNLNLKFKSLFC